MPREGLRARCREGPSDVPDQLSCPFPSLFTSPGSGLRVLKYKWGGAEAQSPCLPKRPLTDCYEQSLPSAGSLTCLQFWFATSFSRLSFS